VHGQILELLGNVLCFVIARHLGTRCITAKSANAKNSQNNPRKEVQEQSPVANRYALFPESFVRV
jgi:hypothetical protein